MSLNITSNAEKSRNPSPNSRSPKLISRFLRSSFARIMSIRSTDQDDDRKSHSEGPEDEPRRPFDDVCSPEYKVKRTSSRSTTLEFDIGTSGLAYLGGRN